MAFLDNSGDIILDAVLTDTGRMRLSKGDGSFKITKFVFADDEINYGLYDKNNASGSAYYDLDILQTPIFEAFTNNASVVKHPLLSISKANLLYLPVMKINPFTAVNTSYNLDGTPLYNNSFYVVTVDSDTDLEFGTPLPDGIVSGFSNNYNKLIRIDQGLDSINLSPSYGDQGSDIDPILKETQYIVEMDNRLGILYDNGGIKKTPSFIDDDEIASYYFTTTDTTLVSQIYTSSGTNEGSLNDKQVIAGYRGTSLAFTIKATEQIKNSTYLFNLLGSTSTDVEAENCYFIDTNVVVRGVTTGTSITIPVRFVKLVT